MSPLTVSARIAAAARLQPMTVAQLAKCLSLHRSTIRRALPVPGVQRVGTVLTKGRPWIAYGVVA